MCGVRHTSDVFKKVHYVDGIFLTFNVVILKYLWLLRFIDTSKKSLTFRSLDKSILTLTDSGSNFVKGFNLFGAKPTQTLILTSVILRLREKLKVIW